MVTNEKESRHGTQRFEVSVDTKSMTAYLFNWSADGWLHGPHKAMTDKVHSVEGITDETINFGVVTIDRKTLKYESAASSGLCEIASVFTPIPTRKI